MALSLVGSADGSHGWQCFSSCAYRHSLQGMIDMICVFVEDVSISGRMCEHGKGKGDECGLLGGSIRVPVQCMLLSRAEHVVRF